MNLLQAITIAVLCINPRPTALTDSVAVLEVHHFYDAEGRLVFDQLIGWEENETVRFWRPIKTESMLPQRQWPSGYSVAFMDNETFRVVNAPSFRERWTQNDVELENREVLAKEKRRELRTKN